MTKVEDTLEERQGSYGTFMDNAAIADALIAAMQYGVMVKGPDITQRVETHWPVMAPDQRLALQHIAAKIGRILTGHTNHIDSWHDIAGYATLIADRLNGKSYYVADAATPSPDQPSVGGESAQSTDPYVIGDPNAPFPPIEVASLGRGTGR